MTANSPENIARAAAADLGPDVLAAIDAPQADDRTRAFGISEAAAIGGFLVQAATLAWTIWQARQDRALLVAALANSEELMQAYPRLDPEKPMSLVARIVQKLLPDGFSHAATEKRRWIAGLIGSRNAPGNAPSRDFIGGATILQPFADEFWWIVCQPIGWLPGAGDGTNLPRVDVPKGFVTDLASVPDYLWAFLQKTGKYGNAAIYHDYLYWQQPPGVTREAADRVFDRAMYDMGVDAVTRNLIWAGVRVFGGGYWEANATAKACGEKRVLKRLPNTPTVTWEDWRKEPGVFV